MQKFNKKKLLIILTLCFIVVCGAVFGTYYAVISSDEYKDIMQAEEYKDSDGGVLPYRIYIPKAYNSQEKYPLVLYLHGAGSRGSDNRAQVKGNTLMEVLLSEENLKKYPCIILAPQCPKDQRWVKASDDLLNNSAVLMELLEKVKTTYSIDTERIYITGNSMGGFGTWGMLRAYPDYFAAAVPICGGWDLEDDVEKAPLMKDIPIWVFHGAKDTTVPVERSRDMVKALENVGGKVKYTEYPEEEHSIKEKVYREKELLPWLFAQTGIA